MPQTLVEKIAQRFAVGLSDDHTVRAGDFLSIRPAHVMTHDNTAAVIPKFQGMGATRVFDRTQPVFALDHDIQNTSPDNLAKYARIEAFAKTHGVAFFPAGRGIGHQIMVEEGFVLPGTFVVGSDSHSNLYGAVGALGTPVVRTDAAAIWATGRTWWQVPDVARVTLAGQLQPGVSAKDVIIALIGVFNHDEVLNCCLEFTGPGVAGMSMEGRLAVSNMTTEWGALAGLFPADDITGQYLLDRAEVLAAKRSQEGATGSLSAHALADEPPVAPGAEVMAKRGDKEPRLTPEIVNRVMAEAPQADAGAFYAKELELDLSTVTPFVAGPNEVKTIVPLPEIEARGVKIDKAFLLSCVNGRVEDFAEAARVLDGRKVAAGVKLYIAAASSEIEDEAKRQGHWGVLRKAGAVRLPPGCGPCIGLGEGVLADGEIGISATNRNFKGRMGSRQAQVYLASPAVVAASAAAGKIVGPKLPGNDTVRRAAGFSPRGASGTTDASSVGTAARTEVRGSSGEVDDSLEKPAPNGRGNLTLRATCSETPRDSRPAATHVDILPGFPGRIEGQLLCVPKDNLNTDGIYGKEYTYKDGMSPAEMGRVAMLNYDPRFQEIARAGDILVGGYNFGSGSSREQAATALKHRGLQMVIAGSFSQTYKRNAFNNGYICIECPKLVEDLKQACADESAMTIRTGRRVMVDFTKSQITVASDPRAEQDEEPQASACAAAETDEPSRNGESPRGLKSAARQYAFAPLGRIAQELIVKGGFETVIRGQLRD